MFADQKKYFWTTLVETVQPKPKTPRKDEVDKATEVKDTSKVSGSGRDAGRAQAQTR